VSDMTRREVVGVLAALAASTVACRRATEKAQAARDTAAASGQAYTPAFFTPHEYATVKVLGDYVIPRDAKSGGATDAGVPEFMDFMLIERPHGQLAMRGGLRWLDEESQARFGKTFIDAADAERRQILDDIAWPRKAKPGLSHGVAFFNDFRDFTASGFWSSKMGVKDLQYMGNTVVPQWDGCPPAALAKLGVSYS
jgi:gluconate 2-dehydrogenase gamma chain